MRLIFATGIVLFLLFACCPVCQQTSQTDLTGTTWLLVDLNGQAVQMPADTEAPSMAFAEGMVRGSDGCNRYQGSYEEQNGQLSFGPLAATRRFCGEPVATIEQGFNQALHKQNGYRIKDGRLELLDGERVLARFTATP